MTLALCVVVGHGLYVFLGHEWERCLGSHPSQTLQREGVESCLPSTSDSVCRPITAERPAGTCVTYHFVGFPMADVLYNADDVVAHVGRAYE